MKSRFRVRAGVFVFLILFVFFLGMGRGGVEDSVVFLVEGKNKVLFDGNFYPEDLIRLHPEIEAVSYFDESLNKSVGYVNEFGGIGKNFLIVKNKTYEVAVSKNTSIIFG